MDKEYSPIDGNPALKECTQKLIFGEASSRIASSQVLSGTGALRVTGDFLHRFMGKDTMYYSDPTWGNHGLIFKNAGFKDVRKYRYYDSKKNCLDFAGFIEDLESAPSRSVIILHACAHNPTGINQTEDTVNSPTTNHRRGSIQGTMG